MASPGRCTLRTAEDGALVVALAGGWRLGEGTRSDAVVEAIQARPPARLAFDAAGLAAWGSELVAFTARVIAAARARGVPVDDAGLPAGLRRLLGLLGTTPVRPPPPPAPRPPLLARIGSSGLARGRFTIDAVAFVGEVAVAFGRLVTGRARIRRRDVLFQIQIAGVHALPVVGLVAVLVGLIFAFVSAVQLELFGAELYVADLVAISMVRDMGAVMAAIVVTGRTAAAYAAELGAMQTGQEIDALRVLGISPVEYLVVPRILALATMMPLLTVYADLGGILGGAIVGVGLMDLPARIYYQETVAAVELGQLVGGVVKGAVYGTLVAAAGCFEGLRAHRSAAGVGRATTAAVVDGIVLVIAAAGVFAVAFYLVGWG